MTTELRAVPNTEPPNLTAQRNADEAMGRALRQLTTAATDAGLAVHVHHFGATFDYASRQPYWVQLRQWGLQENRIITEHATLFVEALDRARDRLNREEWDR